MAHYILNTSSLPAGQWHVGADEPHRDALAPGDLMLIYVGAPTRAFVGHAELAAPVDSSGEITLIRSEEWDPPVPMSTVLANLDPSAKAKADFDIGVVRITEHEYETVLAQRRS